MALGWYYVLLGLFVALCSSDGITVTPFTSCTDCSVQQVFFPSSTEYLMLTGDKNLWYSSDEGQTWSLTKSGVLWVYQFSDVSAYAVLLLSGGFYGSTDGGKTVTQMMAFPNVAINAVDVHMNQTGWIMVYTGCKYSLCQIYYTKGFTSNWYRGPSNVYKALWGHDASQPDLLFALKSDRTFGYTSDYGATWTILYKNSIGFVITDHYLYVGVEVKRNEARLYSSSSRNDPAHTLAEKYVLDEFPIDGNFLPENGYTFLDDTTRSEFIAVSVNQSKYGYVYSSDFDGSQFILTLPYVVQQQMLYDFDKFNGLAGMYVANAYPSKSSNLRQTQFTFDNGGEWRKLNAPAMDYNGNPTNCNITQGCSLHLHGLISYVYGDLGQRFPYYYTSPNAIGLMIGVGNIGTNLTTRNAQTYFTRDAGLTWTNIYDGPTIYEFGDHGGILVFAPFGTATNKIMYSLDEGLSFATYQFINTSIFVDNIFIESSGQGRKFVLLGHSGGKYYIYGLDFTGLDIRGCGDDDYEDWSPSNGDNLNDLCFMGAVTVYTRRKQSSACFNDRDTDHISSQNSCPCDWEDYECDVGYTASPRNSTDGFKCALASNGNYEQCAGYRLIPDTLCDTSKGLVLSPSTCIIGDTSPGKGHAAIVAGLLVLFFLIAGAVTLVTLYWKNERFHEWVLQKIARPSSQGYGQVNTDETEDGLINGEEDL